MSWFKKVSEVVVVAHLVKGDVEMKSHVKSNSRKKTGILGFLSLMVLLASTGAMAADKSKADAEFPPFRWTEVKGEWKSVQVEKQADTATLDKSFESLGNPKDFKALDFVKLFVTGKAKSKSLEPVAMTHALLDTLQRMEKADSANFKTNAELLFQALSEVKGSEFGRFDKLLSEKPVKFGKDTNAEGVDKLFKIIQAMLEKDPSLKDKDLSELMEEIYKDEKLLSMLGLSAEELKLAKKEEPKKDEPKKDDEPKIAERSATPSTPPPPPVFPNLTERSPEACVAERKSGVEDITKFLESLLPGLLGNNNNKPQVDPNLRALADRVAPEESAAPAPVQSSAPVAANNNQRRPVENDDTADLEKDPVQQQQPEPFIGTPGQVKQASNERAKFKKFADASQDLADGETELTAATSALSKLKAEGDKPENNPLTWIDPVTGMVTNQVGYSMALRKNSELEFIAREREALLRGEVEAKMAKKAMLDEQLKKWDAQNGISSETRQELTDLEAQLAANEAGLADANTAVKRGATPLSEEKLAQWQKAVKDSKAAVDAQKKKMGIGEENFMEVDRADAERDSALLAKQIKTLTAKADDAAAKANEFGSMNSKAQMAIASARQVAPQGAVRNAEKLLNRNQNGGGTSNRPSNRPNLGSAVGGSERGSLKGKTVTPKAK